ncbi:unnamed protein product [Bursaphelenchus okinawaensis]|uniref:Uncharacterized protein n=1 Tax=Bursaphelenchus okinawaensis TaxID=465554 RepID=A0A811KYN6_9BILA|nr:unnamed protein product [Bursaphelenchus okinawaensis]CAG9113878.1 unnamed protein product [Bursaphelenchus okinawaensis]
MRVHFDIPWDLHPASSTPNLILYGKYSRFISLVAHFFSVWVQAYFIFVAIITKEYMLIVFPGCCLITYGSLYFGILGQFKHFIIPAIVSDILSIIAYSIQIYVYKTLLSDEDLNTTHITVALYASPIVIVLKLFAFLVLYRSYHLIQSPLEGNRIGIEYFIVFLVMHGLCLGVYFVYAKFYRNSWPFSSKDNKNENSA